LSHSIRNIVLSFTAAALLSIAAGPTLAQNSMGTKPGDSMKSDGMAVKTDPMSKDNMGTDAMRKDAMGKDAMKSDAMGSDPMAKKTEDAMSPKKN